MSEPAQIPEDIFENEEFRNAFLNFTLHMNQQMELSKRTLFMIEMTPFGKLTPEHWAKISQGLDAMKFCLQHLENVNKSQEHVLDNLKAQEFVREKAQEMINEKEE